MRRPLAILALSLAAAACGTTGPDAEEDQGPLAPSADSEEGDAYDAYDPVGKADGYQLPKGPVQFTRACEKGDRITIAAVGDVLLHGGLQVQATKREERFRSLWLGIQDLLGRADLTYANLEGPTAQGVNSYGKAVTDPGLKFDEVVYTSYPMFNYHPSLVDDLLATGVDVVSTANNHSVDRRALGVDRTLAALDERGMKHTGTRNSSGEGEWYTVTEQAGFRIAWLACTYATNGITDSKHQVLNCYSDAEVVSDKLAELVATPGIDAVIMNPHWGEEYSANPKSTEVKLAHKWLDAGATAIIGSHPHVLQPWEKYTTADGREAFVIYSMGNFVSGQSQLARRSTLLLNLGLTRGEDGKVFVNGVRFMPLCMTKSDSGVYEVKAVDRASGLADSRALTLKMFDKWNLDEPDAPLDTTPQCDPSWTPQQ